MIDGVFDFPSKTVATTLCCRSRCLCVLRDTPDKELFWSAERASFRSFPKIRGRDKVVGIISVPTNLF